MEEIQEIKWQELNKLEDYCIDIEYFKKKIYHACGLPKEFFETNEKKLCLHGWKKLLNRFQRLIKICID